MNFVNDDRDLPAGGVGKAMNFSGARPPRSGPDVTRSLPWLRDARWAQRAVVAGSFLALCVSPYVIVPQTNGLVVGPMTHELGWSRTIFFLGPSIATTVAAVLTSVLGLLADRIGIRPILLAGVVAYGLAIMGMALLTGSVGAYFALCILMYAAGMTQTSLLYAKAISEWFSDRRGLMLSIALSGLGAGSILIPFIAGELSARLGWRGVYAGLGLLVLILALPSIFFLVQQPPKERAAGPAPVVISEGLSLREAARTRTYWILILLFAIGNGALLSLVNNLVPVLTSHDVALPLAAAAMSGLGVSQTVTRLISGYVLDRAPYARIGAIWYVLATGGAAILIFAHTPQAAIGAGLLIGTAWGAENELAAYFVGRYFGFRSYGLVLGSIFMALALTGMPFVLMTARLFDTYGGYDLALFGLTGCLGLSCLLAVCLGPYKFTKSGLRLTEQGAAGPGWGGGSAT